MSVCKKYKFPSLFINQFYPRKGTPAARMPKIPTDMVINNNSLFGRKLQPNFIHRLKFGLNV